MKKYQSRKKGFLSKALSALLTLMLVVTMTPAAFMLQTAEAAASTGDSEAAAVTADSGELTCPIESAGYLYYGSYPQTEIVGQADQSVVNGKSWAKAEDYEVDAKLYTELSSATTWDASDDYIAGDGTKYHRITVSDTYHYFRYDPIKWRVLEINDEDAFLLADIALDNQQYYESKTSVTWNTSTIRTWLNSTFLNRAFSAEEQNAISSTNVVNSNNISFGTAGGSITTDKIFLLSEKEVYTDNATKYGFAADYSAADEARKCQSSTYAKAMGVTTATGNYLGNCSWWLRSPGCDAKFGAYVENTGSVSSYGSVANFFGIRPALHLNLQTANISETSVSVDAVQLSSQTLAYDGTAKTPEVTIKGLTSGTDYNVSYSNNINPGTATVTITGTGKWSGTITKTFTIFFGKLLCSEETGYIYFGLYPQTEIVSQADQSVVNGKSWAKAGDYVIDAKLYTELSNATTWVNNDYTAADGIKYHRVNVSSSYHYFRYDPIKWRVLEKKENDVFLLADVALDRQPYKDNESYLTWEKSDIRSWLNSTFLNMAFSAEEKRAIKSTTIVDNNVNTTDKIFLLSKGEFDTYIAIDDKAKRCQCSTYAAALGLLRNNTSTEGTCEWWLLSRGESDRAYYVFPGGGTSNSGRLNSTFGVRPALHLNLETANISENSVPADCVNLSCKSFIYDGTAKTPEVSINGLTKDTDYTVSYSNNTNPGTAIVIITGTGKWSGTINRPFTISLPEMETTGSITSEKSYDCIYFGTYPQTEIVSQDSKYGAYGRSWTAKGDYEVDVDLYYELIDATTWDANEDYVAEDSTKYHRIAITDATCSTSGDTDYYNWGDSTTYRYFRYDPIKWRVLQVNGDDALLLADVALDDQKYNSSTSITWENSTIRSWLNSSFLDRAFSEEEQGAINTTTVVNSNNLSYGTAGGNSTNDRIFLLSEEEVYSDNATEYGFAADYGTYDKARQCQSSTYAKAMGLRTSSDGTYMGSCYWWLRSPGNSIGNAVCVNDGGNVNRNGNFMEDTNIGIRPALHLNLQASSLYSDAEKEVISTNAVSPELDFDTYLLKEGDATPEVSIPGFAEGKDYTVAYSNNASLGIATITITGRDKGPNRLIGTWTRTFAVTGAVDISRYSITVLGDRHIYKGSPVCPEIEIPGLTEGEDYEVTYSNNEAVGTGTVTATGKNGHTGSISETFSIIDRIDISDYTITVPNTAFLYSGTPVCPEVSIEGLTEGEDYEVTYSKNEGAGIGRITATGTDGYKGSITATFKIINDINSENASLSAKALTYTGKALTPAVTIKGLTEGEDFTVACSNNVKVGTATATLTGIGAFGGAKSIEFKINPKKPAISKLTPGAKKLTVKMSTKVTATGGSTYEIWYKAKGTAVWKKTTATTQTITLKSLKKGKKYQVKVRAYKKINGVYYYGTWTTIKTSGAIK